MWMVEFAVLGSAWALPGEPWQHEAQNIPKPRAAYHIPLPLLLFLLLLCHFPLFPDPSPDCSRLYLSDSGAEDDARLQHLGRMWMKIVPLDRVSPFQSEVCSGAELSKINALRCNRYRYAMMRLVTVRLQQSMYHALLPALSLLLAWLARLGRALVPHKTT